ncbi:uncharacterized protein LOC131845235 [Achroia grisella]|uniref:uncharacterized protein LOC131845235 n=1 Tax=Achroia grisella TaxID=688607 RepID=UPI0027D30724|nr:uncharacterized protein LOC131845235 [Achroia grisella]
MKLLAAAVLATLVISCHCMPSNYKVDQKAAGKVASNVAVINTKEKPEPPCEKPEPPCKEPEPPCEKPEPPCEKPAPPCEEPPCEEPTWEATRYEEPEPPCYEPC